MKDLSLYLQNRSAATAYVLLTWITLLIVYHGIYGAFFPTPQGTVGHDFEWALPAFVDGLIWFAKNGLWSVPWFTPSFCGGQPFFADPQSAYYSVPQWLTLVTDPLTASYLTLLLFTSAGYFGTYLLARRSFALPVSWAILAAALYFFNGFFAHRMIVGHTGYHGLALTPWLALALLAHSTHQRSNIGLSMLAAIIAAYWLQSGLTTLMVPAILGIVLILLVYRLRQPWSRDLPLRVLIALGISVALSASKLVASLSFYSMFQRTQYLLPGFDNPLALLGVNLFALFGPSEGAYHLANDWLVNSQVALLPHEWAYGFTMAPLLILTCARAIARGKADNRISVGHGTPDDGVGRIGRGTKSALIMAITAISLIPLSLQFYTLEMNSWLKGLPLIGATAAPIRWLIVYLPILPIATALLGRRALRDHQDHAPRLVAGCIVVLIALNLIEPRRYYADQPYRPDMLLAGYAQLAAGAATSHQIQAVGSITDPSTGATVIDQQRNDLMVAGVSQAYCYNPAFGYRLENFPRGRLVAGDVMTDSDGYLNIKNPACYVFPSENGCAPGDHFRVDQRAAAEAFVSYRPFPFVKSAMQRWADWITLVTLVGTFLFLGLAWPWAARRRGTPKALSWSDQ
ncbi:hypothetical protein [uncultured Thiodictyon sp.]|uniref:hypothetical protein n=1 Tax=uncultured Thiodictyon sp. TaxID=1846217 RepID=UPI0025FBB75C|nr:hypothetical protein [uncultured Thiodictyon sp.]